MRAEIDRDAETARIGEAAAAGAVGGFQKHHALARGNNAAGGGDAGRARPYDRDVDITRGLAERRHGGEARGRGKKRAAADWRHGFRMVSRARLIA